MNQEIVNSIVQETMPQSKVTLRMLEQICKDIGEDI